MRGMSGGGFRLDQNSSSNTTNGDNASIADTITSSTSGTAAEDLGRRIWTETQWVNLSRQARDLGLPKLPYFDESTMVLSKEVNRKLWRQLVCPFLCLWCWDH
jgi:hypothetical protein